MKDCSCFQKMFNSVMSLTKRTVINSVTKPQNNKKQDLISLKISNTNPINMNNSKPSNKMPVIKEGKQNKKQTLNMKTESIKQPHFNKIFGLSKKQKSYQKQSQANQKSVIAQVVPQTERNMIQKQDSHENKSQQVQSDQNDLPTEISQIIMNDIGKNVNNNENLYLFNQNQNKQEAFNSLYQKVQLLNTHKIYYQYLVRKRNNNEIRRAFILKSYSSFCQQQKLQQNQMIQKYSNIYENQKSHIQKIAQLTKRNCKYLLKMLDYQLKPPTISLSQNNLFNPGSLVVVFQNIQIKLIDYINQKDTVLSYCDKKSIINQIVGFLSDVHQNKFSVKDLSFDTFSVDQFGNIKAMSLNIENFQTYQQTYQNEINQNQLVYYAPQQLRCKQRNQDKDEQRPLFHSGFSQISNFERIQISTQCLDLWRLGIIISRILTGKFMFEQKTQERQKELILNILEDNQKKRRNSGNLIIKLAGLSLHEMKLIESLFKIDSEKRLRCKQLIELDYLRNILDNSQQYSMQQVYQN